MKNTQQQDSDTWDLSDNVKKALNLLSAIACLYLGYLVLDTDRPDYYITIKCVGVYYILKGLARILQTLIKDNLKE
jgi:hypothetical protein